MRFAPHSEHSVRYSADVISLYLDLRPEPLLWLRDVLAKPPLKILVPTSLLDLSVIGMTDAYGALTGPISSATLPTLLPDPSMSSSPSLMSAAAALSFTINLPLFARCIISPISPTLVRG